MAPIHKFCRNPCIATHFQRPLNLGHNQRTLIIFFQSELKMAAFKKCDICE